MLIVSHPFSMIIGAPKENDPAETRFAILPANVARLVSLGATVQIEEGGGASAGFPSEAFTAAGASIVSDRAPLLASADLILRVRKPSAEDVELMKPGAVH